MRRPTGSAFDKKMAEDMFGRKASPDTKLSIKAFLKKKLTKKK